jgi:ribonuclease BN (tRNA processing enzyme)
MHKQQRATGGILLQVGDQQVHIDPGPGALLRKQEQGIELDKTTAVLVSNTSLEHSNDINVILSALSKPGEQNGVLVAANSMVNPGGGFMEKCKEWIKSLHPVKPGDLVKLGNLNVQALPTKHEDEHALGFKMFTDDFVMSYSSDTEYSQTIAKAYEGSDILILNVTQPMIGKQKNNLNADDAKKIIEQIKPKLAILTHFGEEMLESNPLYEARDIQKITGIQTIAAYDGLKIDPMSYSAISTQKSLHYY